MMRSSLSCILLLIGGLWAQERSFSGRTSRRSVFSAGKPQVLEFNCPEDFGYYPHPSECSQYYVCVFGGALLESCTGGLMYSNELQTCDWPRNVKCKSSSGRGVSTVRIADPRTSPLRSGNQGPFSATESVVSSFSHDNAIRGAEPIKSFSFRKDPTEEDSSKIRQGRFIFDQSSSSQDRKLGFQAEETESRPFNIIPSTPRPKVVFPCDEPKARKQRDIHRFSLGHRPTSHNNSDYFYDVLVPTAALVAAGPRARSARRNVDHNLLGYREPLHDRPFRPSPEKKELRFDTRNQREEPKNNFKRESFQKSRIIKAKNVYFNDDGPRKHMSGPFSLKNEPLNFGLGSKVFQPFLPKIHNPFIFGRPPSVVNSFHHQSHPPTSAHIHNSQRHPRPPTPTRVPGPVSENHFSFGYPRPNSDQEISKPTVVTRHVRPVRPFDFVDNNRPQNIRHFQIAEQAHRSKFPDGIHPLRNGEYNKFENHGVPFRSTSQNTFQEQRRPIEISQESSFTNRPFGFASDFENPSSHQHPPFRDSSFRESSFHFNPQQNHFRDQEQQKQFQLESPAPFQFNFGRPPQERPQIPDKHINYHINGNFQHETTFSASPDTREQGETFPDEEFDYEEEDQHQFLSSSGIISDMNIKSHPQEGDFASVPYDVEADDNTEKNAASFNHTQLTDIKQNTRTPIRLTFPKFKPKSKINISKGIKAPHIPGTARQPELFKIPHNDSLDRPALPGVSTTSRFPVTTTAAPVVDQSFYNDLLNFTDDDYYYYYDDILYDDYYEPQPQAPTTTSTTTKKPTFALTSGRQSLREQPLSNQKSESTTSNDLVATTSNHHFPVDVTSQHLPSTTEIPPLRINHINEGHVSNNMQSPTTEEDQLAVSQKLEDNSWKFADSRSDNKLANVLTSTSFNLFDNAPVPDSKHIFPIPAKFQVESEDDNEIERIVLDKDGSAGIDKPFRSSSLQQNFPLAFDAIQQRSRALKGGLKFSRLVFSKRRKRPQSLAVSQQTSTKVVHPFISSKPESTIVEPFSTHSFHNRIFQLPIPVRVNSFEPSRFDEYLEDQRITSNRRVSPPVPMRVHIEESFENNHPLPQRVNPSATRPSPNKININNQEFFGISSDFQTSARNLPLRNKGQALEHLPSSSKNSIAVPSASRNIPVPPTNRPVSKFLETHRSLAKINEETIPQPFLSSGRRVTEQRNPVDASPFFEEIDGSISSRINLPSRITNTEVSSSSSITPSFSVSLASSISSISTRANSSLISKISQSNSQKTNSSKPKTIFKPITFLSSNDTSFSNPKFPEQKDKTKKFSISSHSSDRGSSISKPKPAPSGSPKLAGSPPQRLVRPSKKPPPPSSRSSFVTDIWQFPPRRPTPLYPQPPVDTQAQPCNQNVCILPDCFCGAKDIPGGIPASSVPQMVLLTFDDAVNDLNKGNIPPQNIPQMVLLTFDDSVNDLNKKLYVELFERGRVNPNGCPIAATFYVSHEWTDYSQVQNLYADGHEIASHSVTHSFGEQFSELKWAKEIGGQREIMSAYAGVRMDDIRGMRAPFLAVGGNNMYRMLYNLNFTYDSSMPVYENRPPSWPYTLDYKIFHDCMIPPCPTNSYPGVWHVPMVMWQDLNGGRCSMGDACTTPGDAEGVYKMLIKNFERHYTTNRSPFGLYYHAAWFTTPHHKEGFVAFLDTISAMDDVWLVTNWQALQWVRNPVPLNRARSFIPFQCDYPERPPRCTNRRVCNVWHKGSVRYLKTCYPCPETYPWVGNTGVDSPLNDI